MGLQAIAEAVADWGSRKPLVGRVWFFGSRVRGDHQPDSDLDIAIELDQDAFEVPDESSGMATWMFEADQWSEELQRLCPYAVQIEQFIPGFTPTIASGLARSSLLVYEKAGLGVKK